MVWFPVAKKYFSKSVTDIDIKRLLIQLNSVDSDHSVDFDQKLQNVASEFGQLRPDAACKVSAHLFHSMRRKK